MGDYWTSHLKIISSSEANYAQTGSQIWFQFCQGTVEFQAYLLNRVEWSEAFLTFSSWQPGSTCCRHSLSCPLLLGGTPAGQVVFQITSVWGSISCKWYSRINEHPLEASSQYVTLCISVSPMLGTFKYYADSTSYKSQAVFTSYKLCPLISIISSPLLRRPSLSATPPLPILSTNRVSSSWNALPPRILNPKPRSSRSNVISIWDDRIVRVRLLCTCYSCSLMNLSL